MLLSSAADSKQKEVKKTGVNYFPVNIALQLPTEQEEAEKKKKMDHKRNSLSVKMIKIPVGFIHKNSTNLDENGNHKTLLKWMYFFFNYILFL